jgi:hypothetical protein
MSRRRYRFAGETVQTELPLPLPIIDTVADGAADAILIEVAAGELAPLVTRPPETYVVRGLLGGAEWAVWREPNSHGWSFAAGALCAGTMDDALRNISITAARGVPSEWVAGYAVNWVLAYRRALQGRWSFHGSAVVDTGGDAVAFFGRSGAGKSTFAAACCVAGAELLADDVVVGEVAGGIATVLQTATSVRMRTGADALLAVTGGMAHRTVDGRSRVLAPSRRTEGRLRRLYFLERGPQDRVERLPTAVAVAELVRNSKIVTWADDRYRHQEFEAACDLVAATTSHRICVADPTDAANIARLCGLEL